MASLDDDEVKLMNGIEKFREIMGHEGFEFFMAIVQDEYPEALKTEARQPRAGWTMGEEYAYRTGIVDAATEIRELPQQLIKRAIELIDKKVEAPK